MTSRPARRGDKVKTRADAFESALLLTLSPPWSLGIMSSVSVGLDGRFQFAQVLVQRDRGIVLRIVALVQEREGLGPAGQRQ